MHVTRLDIKHLRRFEELRLQPGTTVNLITGDNGAGKTSVLEALHLMAYGRSFRGRVRDGLVRTGEDALEVFVEWQEFAGGVSGGAKVATGDGGNMTRTRRAGLRHSGQDWDGRLDGARVPHLGELCAALAVVTFEPGSHALVTGSADIRRRYLDWGLFHVEPGFLPLWRRYSRALKQRNALLKSRAGSTQIDAWDRELADSGEPLTRYRQQYVASLQPLFFEVAADLAPGLGDVTMTYHPGWRRDDLPLADALLLARERDLQTGFTSLGPHRADWRINFSALPGREALSRGQGKLTALAALLAQAGHYATLRGEWPVIALDDLSSELDRNHQQRVLRRLSNSGAQVFITGTEPPAAMAGMALEPTLFHVEQGVLRSAQAV